MLLTLVSVLMLMQAIPRINSKGQLFGAVYKVASVKQLPTETVENGNARVTVERRQYLESAQQ